MTLIETKRLTKQYGKILSVNQLDMTVPEGSIYGFLGPKAPVNPPRSKCCWAWCTLQRETFVFLISP